MRRAAAAIAALLLVIAPAPAQDLHSAPPFPPVLEVYADWLATSTATALACRPDAPAADIAAARAMFIGSLLASGLSAPVTGGLAQRLNVELTIDCAGGAASSPILMPPRGLWSESVRSIIDALGLVLVEHPVTADQLARIGDVFASETPLQARMLACIAVTDPAILPIAAHDWDGLVLAAGATLRGAGAPHDEVGALVDSALTQAIWQRAAAGTEPALRQACAAESAWQLRFATFGSYRLKSEIDAILGTTP